MNVGFVNPLLLWGMLLGGLPIIIHLINRRRARKIRFSATYFVQLSNRRLARSLKLKQILLLLFRTLLLLLLPLLVSRPYLIPPAGDLEAADTGGVPTSRVIVIDRSLSMRADLNGESLFERAGKKAAELVTSFGDRDNFGLIFAPLEGGMETVELTFDRGAVLDGIEDASPSTLLTDFSAALDRLRLMIEGSALKEKRVYLIGDVTRVGYDLDFTVESGGAETPLTLMDVREGKAIPNAAILDVQAERSFFTGPRNWKIIVTTANYSPEPLKGLPVSITADGEDAATGFISMEAFGTATKEFIQRFDRTGRIELEVAIGGDALSEDNRFFTVLNVSKSIHALLVNGNPSTTRHRDEVFYLREALNPGGLNRSRIHPETIAPDLLHEVDFRKHDLVFLCHVQKIRKNVADSLIEFVSGGGGIFISVGPHVEVDNYNQVIPMLLPGRLRGEREAGDATATSKRETVVFLSRFDYGHPAFRVFDDETAQSLYQAPVRHYLTFDPDATRPKTILASFSDQAPAIVEVPYGKGRVLLFTSTISREWNDIPIQPGFLPLMQELSRSTVGGREDSGGSRFRTGMRYQLPDGESAKKIATPTGRRVDLLSGKSGGPPVSPPLAETGIYKVLSESGEFPLAVNVDTTESDLSPLGENDRQAVFGGAGRETAFTSAGAAEHRIEYSGTLGWLLLLIFALEILVLRWMG